MDKSKFYKSILSKDAYAKVASGYNSVPTYDMANYADDIAAREQSRLRMNELTKSKLNPVLAKAKAKDESSVYRSPRSSYEAISRLQTGAIEQVSPEFDILTGIRGVISMAKPALKGIGAAGDPGNVDVGILLKSVGDRLRAAKQNVYKINPWAFKPNPEAYYRVGYGTEFIDDVLRTNKIRVYNKNSYAKLRETGKISGIREDGKIVLKAKTFPEADTYWTKGVPLDGRFSSQKYGDYMIEASDDIPFIQAVNQRTKQKGFWDAPDVNYNSTHAKGSYVKPRQSYGYDAEGNIKPSIGTALEYSPEFIKLYRPHWLKGYKEIKPGTASKSAAKQLHGYGDADDVGNMFKGLYTDKEHKESLEKAFKWFEHKRRLDNLPATKNKEALGVLGDFKHRIQTAEGKKRMKELGIDNDELLQKIQIVEDRNTFGSFSGVSNKIILHPEHPLSRKVTRHEIEHGVQNAKYLNSINKAGGTEFVKDPKVLQGTTEIDDLLSRLELRKQVTPNKNWLERGTPDSPVNISEYKYLVSEKQRATDYFLTGSEGREKSAFLGEVQQYMMDNNIIPKTSYTKITPEMVKNTFVDAMFDEDGGGKYLRLFNIMKPTEANYKLISEGLNKMLGITPPAVTIAAGGLSNGRKNKEKTR